MPRQINKKKTVRAIAKKGVDRSDKISKIECSNKVNLLKTISDDQSLWALHADKIVESKAETVMELATGLQKVEGKFSGIAGISKADALVMLMDIGLMPLPFARKYKNELIKAFQGSISKLTISSLIATLEKKINAEPDLMAKQQLITELNAFQSQNINPFEDHTHLSDYPRTAYVFILATIKNISSIIGIPNDQIAKLTKHYATTRAILGDTNKNIQLATGLSYKDIETFKKVICFYGNHFISPSLSVALAKTELELVEMIAMTEEVLKNKIETTGVKVPEKEKSPEILKKIIEHARKNFPKETYFQESISSLKLPDAALSTIKNNKISIFSQLRQKKLMEKVISSGKLNKTMANKLKAFSRLEVITTNPVLAKVFITDKVMSVYQLSCLSLPDIKKKYGKLANAQELDMIHQKALQVTGRNMAVAGWANMLSRGLHVDDMVPGNIESRKIAEAIMKGVRK